MRFVEQALSRNHRSARCFSNSNPGLFQNFLRNTDYAWYHNDKEIIFAEEQLISIFVNNSLYISVATNQTLGNYSCQASANSQVLIFLKNFKSSVLMHNCMTT